MIAAGRCRHRERAAWRAVAPILGAAACAGLAQGVAAEASRWHQHQYAAVRLVSGPAPSAQGAPLRAGVEIRLAGGWKTYWRYPGDSGVPPKFDFSGSANLASAKVLYPAPKRFADGSGQAIGYTDAVVFPVRVVAKDPTLPVHLRLKLEYAVCKKLCVPVEAQADLPLPAGGESSQALAAAEARVPTPSVVGAGGALAIRSVSREDSAKAGRVVVEVASADQTVDLFAEGPDEHWSLPLPERLSHESGVVRFAFALDGLPSGTDGKGAVLRLTAVTPNAAIEAPAKLD